MGFDVKGFFNTKIKKASAAKVEDPSNLPAEAKLAACAILLEVASIDGEFAEVELAELAMSLENYFGFSRNELKELLAHADQKLRDASDIGEFADLINKHFALEHKYALMVLVWQVIMADGKLEKQEERFAAQIRERLQLTDELTQRAREEARALYGQ